MEISSKPPYEISYTFGDLSVGDRFTIGFNTKIVYEKIESDDNLHNCKQANDMFESTSYIWDEDKVNKV